MGRHARAKPTLAARLLRLLLEQPGQAREEVDALVARQLTSSPP